MEGSSGNILGLFPNKLIANILAILRDRDLASCTQVCKRMVDIIGGSTLLQYRLELGRSGMVDGPLSTLSVPERLERLRAYNDAWKHLRWSACLELPNIDVVTHDMDIAPGDILTFVSRREHKIIFVQIPSNSRGIPMRRWEHSLSFLPHQYALDPSEDILVVSEWDRGFHFLSLTTGEPHSLAAIPIVAESLMDSLAVEEFQLSMGQNYLAILDPKCELCVYNWKTGQIVLSGSSEDIHSVSFLPENRLLVATSCLSDLAKDTTLGKHGDFPVLAVYDLGQVSASQHDAVVSPIAVFSLDVGDEFDLSQMVLHYRPNIHSYSVEVAVPFFRSPSDELIALQTNGFWNNGTLTDILLIPLVRLTSHITSSAAGDVPMRYIPWSDWGVVGTRWVDGPYESSPFRGSLSGSRFIPDPKPPKSVDIWDFGRARVAQLEREPQQSDRDFLLCVQTQVALPMPLAAGHTPVAISEDALIFQHHYESKTYILVF